MPGIAGTPARYLAWFSALCALLLLFPGCLGKAAPSLPSRNVTIAYATSNSSFLMILALKPGCFAEEGLDVTPLPCPSGKACLDAMLSGRADIATVAETPFMFQVMNGSEPVIFATILSTNQDDAVIARKDRGIDSASDLEGKKIGVTMRTAGEYFLAAYLRYNGLGMEDVTPVDVPPESIVRALLSGEVDAVSGWNPQLAELKKALGTNAAYLHDENIYTKTFNVSSTHDFIGKNPDTIRKVLRALLKAEDHAKKDPSGSRRWVSEYAGLDLSQLSESLSRADLTVRLNQSLLVTLEEETRWAIRSGLSAMKTMPNYLNYIHMDGLASVKPYAVKIIR